MNIEFEDKLKLANNNIKILINELVNLKEKELQCKFSEDKRNEVTNYLLKKYLVAVPRKCETLKTLTNPLGTIPKGAICTIEKIKKNEFTGSKMVDIRYNRIPITTSERNLKFIEEIL